MGFTRKNIRLKRATQKEFVSQFQKKKAFVFYQLVEWFMLILKINMILFIVNKSLFDTPRENKNEFCYMSMNIDDQTDTVIYMMITKWLNLIMY